MVPEERLPKPSWHLLKGQMKDYIMDDSIDVLSSRGCPHSCSFCYNISYHHRSWRKRDVTNVLGEIDWITANSPQPIKFINFVDDMFFTNKKHGLEIFKELSKRNLKAHIDLRCNDVTKELIEKLFNYGLRDIYFGAESGSQKILDLMCKDTTVKQIKNACKIVSQFDISTTYSFILGYPGETLDDRRQTLTLTRWIYKNVKNVKILVGIYTVYPGTEHYEQYRDLIKDNDQDYYNWNTARDKPWIQNKANVETLCTMYRFFNVNLDLKRYGFLGCTMILVLHHLAKFRISCNLFKFPFEFYCINYVLQRKKFI